MRKPKDNLDHRIQLKKDEIERYQRAVANYSFEKMKMYGIPHLTRLQSELDSLIKDKEYGI